MSTLTHWIWLLELRGLTNQVRLSLLRHFGTPEKIYYADTEEILLTEGITPEQAAALKDHDCARAERILAECLRQGISLLTIQDAAYPGRLKNIFDPPVLLYMKGRLPVVDDLPVVSVVGTRSCTPYGLSAAEELGYDLAKCGAVVVSGLAKGIDAAAMRGALRAGGTVIGVVGNGLDVKYPEESRELYDDVAAVGGLLSEYPPKTRPLGVHFPVRNRILAGLSIATLVVEAPLRSGALITSDIALEQGRDVFAVPGPIHAENSKGCNRLIQNGAGLVMEAADLLREYKSRFPDKLRLENAGVPKPLRIHQARQRTEAKPVLPALDFSNMKLTEDQIALMRHLDGKPKQVDELVELAGIPARRVLSALTMLEIDGLVIQHSGKRYTGSRR